jgi:hypothetical protein
MLNQIKDKVLILLDQTKVWVTNRLEERTTWDGVVLVGIGVLVLIAKPLAGLAAYAVICWGIWTIVTAE